MDVLVSGNVSLVYPEKCSILLPKKKVIRPKYAENHFITFQHKIAQQSYRASVQGWFGCVCLLFSLVRTAHHIFSFYFSFLPFFSYKILWSYKHNFRSKNTGTPRLVGLVAKNLSDLSKSDLNDVWGKSQKKIINYVYSRKAGSKNFICILFRSLRMILTYSFCDRVGIGLIATWPRFESNCISCLLRSSPVGR